METMSLDANAVQGFSRRRQRGVTHCALALGLLAAVSISAVSAARAETSGGARAIVFPNAGGFEVLKCDLHIHSVFSDGLVWPTVRVEEALKDDLDAIALTEHLEYLPHHDDIPLPDHDRAYDLVREQLDEMNPPSDLILIRGSEVTREMPPGHANAIFIEDADRLLLDDPVAALREARKQGAFVFWNHPNWTGQRKDGIATLLPMHRQLIADGLLQGIEVVNDTTYSDEALAIAIEHKLAIIGSSDVHGLVDWQYRVPEGGHRPVTLVFARERSEAAIKEALFAGRTVAWLGDLLVGHQQFLVPLLEASIVVKEAHYSRDSSVLLVTLENRSSARHVLANASQFTLHDSGGLVTIEPKGTTVVSIKTLKRLESVELPFDVLTALVAPKTHPRIVVAVSIPQ